MTQQRPEYDVCIIGSGAGGGMAAHVLTQAGANVVMLEAGPEWFASKNATMMMPAYASPRRGAATRIRPFGEFDACDGGFNIEGEPYTRAQGTQFNWWRARMLGGRTNHWGRISLRFGPHDFKPKTRDGLGMDWPITYNDIKPYYDRVDRFVGIFGSNENLPNDPDGIFQPAPRPRCYELLVKKASDKLNITCIPARMSVITRPLPGRAACHYCGQCNRGCTIKSNFSSPDVLIAPALATKRLTLLTNAMAREVTLGTNGLANGVSFINKNTGADEHVRAKIVVLAASACETARILLNSKSTQHPQGLANSSGKVGKYLTDTTGVSVSGFIPSMMDHIPHNEDGIGGQHIYMPWWLDNKQLGFARGYHIEVYGGPGAPGSGFMGNIQRFEPGGGYGEQLKKDYRRYYGASIGFSGRGEMIPNDNSFCELDPDMKDKFGIPVLRFHWQWSDHEIDQAGHMHQTFRELIDTMGGTVTAAMPTRANRFGISTGGSIIHELGCAIMGSDKSTSVVNANCQAHDVKNLFVTDGSPFVSQPDKNPTWTILALAWKTSDYIAQQRRSGAI